MLSESTQSSKPLLTKYTTPVCVEYIWIGGSGELRSKTRIMQVPILSNNDFSCEHYPKWTYDGSSTNQATTNDSEIILEPYAVFKDPFRNEYNKLVLCNAYTSNNEPVSHNFRNKALEIFNKKIDEEPWFGLEQEYFIMDPKTKKPIGFPDDNDAVQGQYYCSIGGENAFGRQIVEEHLQKCLKANIKIAGVNAEVAPGQWEFQIGPCVGIEQGDHMYIARYILQRVAEKYGVYVSFDPKPLECNWNGSGCHINFSTKNMREGTENKNGLEYIEEAISKLALKHNEHMEVYGENNNKRMTGDHETASYDVFSDGVANRGASIRRGYGTIQNKCGYFEDRRPASNCDPYLATSKLFETCVL